MQPAPEQVIVVTAPRSLPAPDRLLGRQDIDSYGSGSIGELLGEIASEEGEDGPLVLVNGRRVSGLDELSDYPPEALRQVEVLPAGSGPAVGGSPTRKVVNLVLERRFDGRIGRGSLRTATEGGWSGGRVEGTATRIRGDSRFNLTLRGRREGALLESERDITAAERRTLIPALSGTDLSLSGATRFGEQADLSATGRLTFSKRGALLGNGPFGLREQDSRLLGGRLNSTLNAEAAGWSLSLLGSLEADRRRVLTDLDGLLASEQRRSLLTSGSASLEAVATRVLFALPAGALQLNLGAGFTAERFTSSVRRAGSNDRSRYSERALSASAGVVLPLAGGPERVLAPLGELNLSFDAGLTRVEGGSFRTGSLGLVWQPLDTVRVSGGISRAAAPAAVRFRREAVVATPGVLVFDPLTGASVRVTEVAGPLVGSVRARSDSQRLGVTFSPDLGLDLRIESEWSRRSERDFAGDLPLASAAVLAAFPERFVRDPSGLLTALDVSPIVFARRSESQVRNAVNLRVPLGGSSTRSSAEESGDEEEREAPRGGRPRLQLSLAHTLLLGSEITLREGLAPIDLLSRAAIAFGGGRPRHQLDAAANFSSRGLGLRLGATYRSASRLAANGEAGEAPDSLRFGALRLFNLRAFANAEQLLGRNAIARGTRLSLTLNNVFNAREAVTDRAGFTPLAYQPAFRDALGRTVEFEIRRRF